MPFSLILPRWLAKMRWKVKIRDRERVEDPHVTIIRGPHVWRICLRDGHFMDEGSWKDFPDELRTVVEGHWEQLCHAWDGMYPHNPVRGEESANEE